MRESFQKITSNVKELWATPSIRTKLIFTIGIILLYRFLANVPPPGIDAAAYNSVFADNPLTNIFTIATGGSIDNPSLVMLGLGPYINASIIIQLLTTVIPKLEELSKEGASGKRVISQYTRILAIPLSIMQAIVFYVLLSRSLNLISPEVDLAVLGFIAAVAAGGILMMWFGELITENGVGNGSSILITFSVITSLPSLFLADMQYVGPAVDSFINGRIPFSEFITTPSVMFTLVMLIGLLLLVVVMVFFNEGTRKVPIQYARRIGRNAQNYLPIRVNQAGVMPIIFASSIMAFPAIIAQVLLNVAQEGSQSWNIAQAINNSFFNDYQSLSYILVFFVLIVAFTFFYVFVIMKPANTAENLQKSGGFVPGIRPGKNTESYIKRVMFKLTVIGAIFLAIVAIIPSALRLFFIDAGRLGILSGIGGTSLLIVVSVILTTYRQVQSMKVTHNYDKYR